MLKKEELPYLKLWESIITGRAAPLSKLMKEQYKNLGLSHIFTPSGFHLSAVLFPFMKVLKRPKHQLILLLFIAMLLMLLPGMQALKRMVLIKSHQKLLGLKLGFICALILDIFFGSFQIHTLSFTYSLLFLSMIYSGARGLQLIFWFFIGQLILAYFQGLEISLLILIFSPLINLAFSVVLPFLFFLTFPLWDWQLWLGIRLLTVLHQAVSFFSALTLKVPFIEVHVVTLILMFLILKKKRQWLITGIIFFCQSLNPDYARSPGLPSKEFAPQGEIQRRIYRTEDVRIVFSDGSCKMKLIRGFWWESCSPRRKSRKR